MQRAFFEKALFFIYYRTIKPVECNLLLLSDLSLIGYLIVF